MSNATVFRSSFKDINRKSISESNLLKNDFNDELPLNDSERAQENLANMKVRKDALEETLEKKLNELRQLCLRESELTGVLPKEFPLKENEELPTIRRRVQTKFTFSDKLLMQPKTKEEEKLKKLELEFEIQCKIVKATKTLWDDDMISKKSIKKQRKQVYQQAVAKLKDIEKNLQLTKKIVEEEQSRKMKRKNSIRCIDNELLNNNNNELSDNENNLNKQQFDLFNKDLNCLTMQSAPSTPVRCKLRNKNYVNELNDQLTTNPRIDNLIRQRFNNNSPEYDTISSSSLGSANNVFLNNYCKLKNTDRKPNEFNNYEELIENSPETQAKKYFGVPTRRSAIAPNFSSQDDSNILLKKQQQDLFYPSLDKYTNERLRSLTRHNSLDKFKQQEALKSLENNLKTTSIDTQRLSSTNLLSPNQLQANQFNFSSFKLSSSNSLNNNQLQMKNIINKSQGSVNMAQRPLPSPPRTAENKKLLTNNNQTKILNNPKQLSSNKPPPLNLNDPSDLLNNKINYGSLIKTNPIRSPSTVSMFLQSPLDFEKATNLCLNKQQKYNENERNLIQNNNRLDQRDTIVRATPVTLTAINCSNEQLNQNQQHSPVPILPPRTPITSKPTPITNPLNSLNNFNSLNSYQQMSNFPKNMISSNPNLNYTTGTKFSNNKINEKKIKTWIETSIDTFKIPNNKFIQNANCYYVKHSENQLNNHHLNAMQFIREKENQLLNNSSLPPRNANFNHQFLKEDSRSSLNSNSLSSNSSSALSSNQSSTSNLHSKSSQIAQPFVVEETKPYELSDFYKYSQKFKNQQKNLQQHKDLNKESTEIHNQQNHFHINQVLNNNLSDVTSPDKQNDSNEFMSMTLVEESFMAKNQVASEFSKEMKDWLKEKYAGQNNKAATLV